MNEKLHATFFAAEVQKESGQGPLYRRLANAIIQSIVHKKLSAGDSLPPTRLLAKDLMVSRSTVIKAYELLCIEQYLKSVQGSGYFVAEIPLENLVETKPLQNLKNTYPKVSERAKSLRKSVGLMNTTAQSGIAFRPGLPPLDVFPVRRWQHLTNRYWKEIPLSHLSYRSSLGLEPLRENIAHYLKMYRNIHCHANQVIIVTGSLHSFSLIGDLMLNKGDEVIVENPTYANAIAILKGLRAKTIPVSLDREGINMKALEGLKLKSPKFIYTTPSNQYPSGIQMSLTRRKSLLEWANKHNCLILEDDYDHEFSNWNDAIPSIFSLDNESRVIYQGTFNKLLHPSIRLGYIIVPPYLVNDIKALYEQSLRFVSPVTQKVMNDFIAEGHLSQHIRNVVNVSNTRRSFFVDHFKTLFKGDIVLEPAHNGLHLVASFKENIDDVACCDYLAKEGITAFPYSKYFAEEPKKRGLILGFSSVNETMIRQKLNSMHQLLERYRLNR